MLIFFLFYITQSCQDNSDCIRGKCIHKNCSCDTNWEGQYCEKKTRCQWGNLVNKTCICNKNYYFDGKNCRQNCSVGYYDNQIDSCVCGKDWKDNSFDSIFLDKKCSQFKCLTDFQCQNLTGYIDSKCPIKGQDCYCGLSNFNRSYPNVKCMNLLLSLTFSYLYLFLDLSQNWIWFISISLSVLSFPFGRRRTKCDHHLFTSWSFLIKNILGVISDCDGNCVFNTEFKIRDEIALSIYWLKVGIWWYLFLSLIILFLGILIVIKELILIFLIILGLFLLSSLIYVVSNISLNNINLTKLCTYNNCDNYIRTYYSNDIYNGGPYPNYKSKYFRYISYIIFPLKYYPQFPDNLQGGLIGYFMGTHIVRNCYLGGNPLIDLFSLTLFNFYDLRNDENWRLFIKGELEENHNLSMYHNLTEVIFDNDNLLKVDNPDKKIGKTKIYSKTNMDDKEKEICWICGDNLMNYHLWKNCNHYFCENCSTSMLYLSYPCPLCRNIPLRVTNSD